MQYQIRSTMRVLLFVGLCFAGAQAGSPVEKVITMMEDLQIEVVNEGKMEAKTYDMYACFCKDMTDGKTTAITDGQAASEELTAKINDKSSERDNIDSEIAGLQNEIQKTQDEIKASKEQRAKERELYEKNKHDVKDGIAELHAAEEVLKHSQSSLLQKQAAMKVLRKAALMADALELTPKAQKVVESLLQKGVAGDEDYVDHTDELVETVHGLEVDFTDEKGNLKDKEQKAQDKHDTFVSESELKIETCTKDLERAEERRSTAMKEIATASQDLSVTLAQLHDDQAYLQDLTAVCEDKASEWDQRSQMRQDELTALTTALGILKGGVSDATSDKTIRFVQKASSVKPHAVAADAPVEEDNGSEEAEDEEDVSFLQVNTPRPKLSLLAKATKTSKPFLQSPRDRLVQLLTTKAESLKSTVLASLANKVEADPFAKIKKLVQELVERLLQEAADEANHKGWCDKELTNARQQRGYKAAAIKTLNSQLAGAEAKRDKLAEEIGTLTKELDELNTSLDSTKDQRKEESAENAATVSEAQEGKEAIEQAIEVLDHFYKTAAKAFVEVKRTTRHKGVDGDAPDTGFSGASKGSQGAAKGIMGMMEVIRSDFVRTIKETEKAEKEADTEYIEFERTTKTSIRTKETTKSTDQAEHSATVDEISTAMDDLKEEQGLMDKALQELEELRPACIDTGMSYEERVARREQEIEALNEALCILDNEGAVQTEPNCADK